MCVKIFRYWIIRAEIVGKRFLPDTVKTAKQDVKPTHPNCSIAIKNEIYSWPLFMIMTIFHVLDLLITEIMELTHLLLTLPFHIERSREINNQYTIADEAGNGKTSNPTVQPYICNL